jgi:uncharacterized protein
MRCPLDNTELLITERQGIEIDYCPQCRGVWLDRGELDKLIERSEAIEQQPHPEERRRPDFKAARRYAENAYDDDNGRQTDDKSYPEKRKRTFLSEMFDIFD